MHTLTNALPIVASAYGRKFGVTVQVGGSTAATDGTAIHLPTIPDESGAKSLAWGYLAHEAGHVRHTDFAVWKAIAGEPLTRAITNILEDVRIENAMIRSYPGTKQTLDAVLDWMIAEGKITAPDAQSSPPTLFANALLVLARHRYRRQPALEHLAQDSESRLRQVFPPSFVHRLLGLMTEIPSLQDTADTAALAQRMVALIQEEAEDSTNESGSGHGPKDEDDGPDGTDTADGSKDRGDDTSGMDTDDSSKDEDGGTSGSDTDEGSTDLELDDDTGQAERSALQAALSANPNDLPKDTFETVAEALGGEGHGSSVTMLPTLEEYAGDERQGRQLLAQAKSHSARLSTRLQGLVQAHTLTRARTVRNGRALSPNRLHRAAVGDSRIFVRKDERQAPNTAIHLLVDLSGSMAGGKDRVALESAMALALALEPIRGVSRAVTAFPGLAGQDDTLTRVLSHGDRAASRAGAFVQPGRGSTPMTGALWFAVADLLPRREERRVVLTLTDGSPDHWESAIEVIGKAGSAGVEMIGVGIRQDVSRLFPVAIRIASVDDLKGELFRIAERLLIT